MIELLKNKQLKSDSVNKEGQTPLMIALENSFTLKTISELIDLGCDVNAQDLDGNTPLHSSVLFENESAFKELLSKGARVDIEDNEGQSVKSLIEEDKLTKFIALIRTNEQLATSELLTSQNQGSPQPLHS